MQTLKPTLEPPLKWAGGKRWLAPKIKKIFELFPGARLVEPFVGGLSVALELQPEQALLNDINVHLLNFYWHLQFGLERKLPMANDEQAYYSIRRDFNENTKSIVLSPIHAERFYYLNRTCYNGLCRFNKKGEFNTPFGNYARIRYEEDFLRYRNQLEDWSFTLGDFSNLELRPNDFIYCDPPYDVPFTTYSPGGFNWADQVRLIEWLKPHKGPILISNQATNRICKLYYEAGFKLEEIDEPRRISCSGDRKPAKTVLAYRNI